MTTTPPADPKPPLDTPPTELAAPPSAPPEPMESPPATAPPLDLAPTALTGEQHRRVAIALFNRAWDLLALTERSPELDDELLHTAHASRLHWTAAGGDATRLATGEWQCARVYAVLGRAEPAEWHAGRALAICRAATITGFLEGAAYEALARAALVAGDAEAARRWAEQARAIAEGLDDEEDREVLTADLDDLDTRLATTDGAG
ncbi:MAG TPA: hypothetical protein VK906_17445 [Egicoccus sp.]|nr:hypothetical protein [Egicoccus sp.]HSK24974.1 hypothetical protein [Egicoccus sp.]